MVQLCTIELILISKFAQKVWHLKFSTSSSFKRICTVTMYFLSVCVCNHGVSDHLEVTLSVKISDALELPPQQEKWCCLLSQIH